MEILADGVVLLQPHLLGEAVTKLKQDIPKSTSVSDGMRQKFYIIIMPCMQVIATIHHISSGKLDGSVYTNGWPEFSSVICQYRGTFSQWVCMYRLLYYTYNYKLMIITCHCNDNGIYYNNLCLSYSSFVVTHQEVKIS